MKNNQQTALDLPLDDFNHSVGLKLTVIGRQLWSKFNQRVEAIGVTRAKWTLIATVSHFPGATQRFIADKLQVTEVTAGRLIDRLCEDGLVERREDPDDRRCHRVYITPAARRLLRRVGDIAETYTREAFAGLSAHDMDTLDTLLGVISNNIGAFRDR